MLPSLVTHDVEDALRRFLSSAFPFTSEGFRRDDGRTLIDDFLDQPGALLKGPWLDLKLPFRLAKKAAQLPFEKLSVSFRPYQHQLIAFQRLCGEGARSTLVATGTGSGKTECFMLPMLDHCLSHRQPGIKAIIIYPMNALATDQARRFAREVSDLDPKLSVGLFTGDDGGENRVMTPEQVITHRDTLREYPPDILLTNYKMLDFLLLRPRDQRLWRHNTPGTLRYLVVDELHTFDGAQGTDLACLIRRLRDRLDAGDELACVGTSATLGDASSSSALSDYAQQVFATTFDEDAIVVEDRLTVDEYLQQADGESELKVAWPTDHIADLRPGLRDQALYLRIAARLWLGEELPLDADDARERDSAAVRLGELLLHHSAFQELIRECASLCDLVALASRWQQRLRLPGEEHARILIDSLCALVSAARLWRDDERRLDLPEGKRTKPFLQVRLQFWLRELRRMVASVGTRPELVHADDVQDLSDPLRLPVLHCRECHAAGWGVVKPEGDQYIKADLQRFYSTWFGQKPDAALFYPLSDESPVRKGLRQLLCPHCLRVAPYKDDTDCPDCGESAIPVWAPNLLVQKTVRGERRLVVSADCPCCGARETLTVLGYRSASLASVMIGELYGSSFNDDYKLIAFSDSVQDAAHRAGFFGARTYSQTVRHAIAGLIRDQGEDMSLGRLADEVPGYWRRKLGDAAQFVGTFIAPNMQWLAHYDGLRRTGSLPADSDLPDLVRRRLRWEVIVEFGLRAGTGRTLERTEVASVGVEGDALERTAERLVGRYREELESMRGTNSRDVKMFLWGVLTRLRQQGAFYDGVLDGYIREGGKEFLLNKLPFMPGYGRRQRPPAFLSLEHVSTNFEALLSQSGKWYEGWFHKTLGSDQPFVAAEYEQACTLMLDILESDGWLIGKESKQNEVWGLNIDRWRVTQRLSRLSCTRCRRSLVLPASDASEVQDAPCLRHACSGRYRFSGVPESDRSYRAWPHRLVTSEHTGLLDGKQRHEIEQSFIHGANSWDVNLLSATPTLEMGIDIGDLSSVLLCSVPPAQANYLQRIGRAGRHDGNAVAFTIANGLPHDLYFYANPVEMMAGAVQPPGVFLRALAVLERQLIAYSFDHWVATGVDESAIPGLLKPVLDAVEAGRRSSFPYNLLDFIDQNSETLLTGFFAMFPHLDDDARKRLGDFLKGGETHGGVGWRVLDRLHTLVKNRASLKRRVDDLKKTIRHYEGLPEDEERDLYLRAAREERDGLLALIRGDNQRQTLNFFTDEGLLPNYAFPEEGVTLHSIILRRRESREVEEGGKRYELESVSFQRSAQAALAELAPEQKFYAVAHRLNIEQIDVRLASPQEWRLCPDCHHVENLSELGDKHTVCPGCGSAGWRDVGQKRTLLKLRQVYARADARQDRIADDSEQREPVFYNRQMLVEIPEGTSQGGYRIDSDELPFGFEYLRNATLREINFGPDGGDDDAFQVAGEVKSRRGFKICRHCGMVKRERLRKGQFPHALDCPLSRKGAEEKASDWIESLYLYRELTSEAVRIRLPVGDVGESEVALHSFVGALNLGLKTYFKGDVHHLEVTVMNMLSTSGLSRRYLVIYDRIPGGTGYLKELMRTPDNLLEMLRMAQQRLIGCECVEDENRDGCYHCILAYRDSRNMDVISRRSAADLLTRILASADKLVAIECLDDIGDNSLIESDLEARFIRSLDLSLNVTRRTVNGKAGFQLVVNERVWELEPQVEYGPSEGVTIQTRADFVLRPARDSERKKIPEMVIYLDGFSHHYNQQTDDTRKRMALLAAGKVVWSLAWHDLPEKGKAPPFSAGDYLQRYLKADMLARYDALARTAGWKPASTLSPVINEGSFRWLLRWLEDPFEARTTFAQIALGNVIGWLNPESFNSDLTSVCYKELSEVVPAPHLKEKLESDDAIVFGGLLECIDTDSAPVKILAGLPRGSLTSLGRIEADAFAYLSLDTSAAQQSNDFNQYWRGYWHAFNMLQFAPTFVGGTQEGIRNHAYDVLLEQWREIRSDIKEAPEQETPWKEVFELSVIDKPALQIIMESDVDCPEVGVDLEQNGQVILTAELCWGDKQVAVVLEPIQELPEIPGWSLVSLESEGWINKLVEQLLGGRI